MTLSSSHLNMSVQSRAAAALAAAPLGIGDNRVTLPPAVRDLSQSRSRLHGASG